MSLWSLLMTADAWAAAEMEHHAPSINQIWFPLLNFLIFAYLIKRFALPLVRDFLSSRREEILSAIEKAAESRQRAQATVQEYKGRLARLNEEIGSLNAALRAEGEREKGKLLEEAEALALKIKEDARFLAAQELKLARQQLRQEIAEGAQAAARELLQRHLWAGDQARLAQDFIRNIGQVR